MAAIDGDTDGRWQQTIQWLNYLDKPWLAVPGNHDLVFNGVPAEHTCEPMSPAGLVAWANYVGPLQFIFETEHTRFVGVNSLDWGTANQAWILQQLQTPKRKVIIQHHPLVWPESPGWVACYPAEMLAMYQAAGVSLVIAGHRHQFAVERLDSMTHVICPPISYVASPNFPYPLTNGLFPMSYPTLGWLEIEDGPGGLAVEFFREDGAMVYRF